MQQRACRWLPTAAGSSRLPNATWATPPPAPPPAPAVVAPAAAATHPPTCSACPPPAPQVPERLKHLLRLKHLRYVDFRGVHSDTGSTLPNNSVWTLAKSTTMQHISEVVRVLGHRKHPTKVWMDLALPGGGAA